jgi:hypothetical protein
MVPRAVALGAYRQASKRYQTRLPPLSGSEARFVVPFGMAIHNLETTLHPYGKFLLTSGVRLLGRAAKLVYNRTK